MAERAQARLASHPGDPVALRNLGIATYRMGRPADALAPLEHALAIRPHDPAALLFWARALDALDRLSPAIRAYGSFVAHSSGRSREVARARLDQLRRRSIQLEAARAVANEESLRTVSIPPGTLAVPDFVNPAESDTLRPLAKGLAVMLITDLSQLHQLRIVERQRIGTLIGEMERGRATGSVSDTSRPGGGTGADAGVSPASLKSVETTIGQQQRLAVLIDPVSGKPYFGGTADGSNTSGYRRAVREFQRAQRLQVDGVAGPKTRAALEEQWRLLRRDNPSRAEVSLYDPRSVPRAGQLLGAHDIVQGSVIGLGTRNILLNADLLAVPSGEVSRSTQPVEGPFTDVLTLQKKLLFEVLGCLGITPSREERKRLSVPPTRNLEAFLAFCRGLDLEDQGLQAEALGEYKRAVALDPGFALAHQAEAVLSVGTAELGGVEQAAAVASEPGPSSAAADQVASTTDRIGVLPDLPESPWVEARQPESIRSGSSGKAIIVVRGHLPVAGREGR